MCLFFAALVTIGEKGGGGCNAPTCVFFHNINYIKRKKRGEMAPMCFFHNTSYIKRKRGETMPPLGFFS
jgi:hypothetical protein